MTEQTRHPDNELRRRLWTLVDRWRANNWVEPGGYFDVPHPWVDRSRVDPVEFVITQPAQENRDMDMTKHDMTPALTGDHHERLEFEEDTEVLNILLSKLFRRAIDADVRLPVLPELEAEVIADSVGHDQLAEATEELDEALGDDSALAREIEKWAQENDAQREELFA